MKKITILTAGVLGLSLILPISTFSADVINAQSLKKEITVAQIKPEESVNQDTVPQITGKEVLASSLTASQIYLIDGVAYDLKGNTVVEFYGQSRQRGKFTWAVKLLRAGYHRLPAGVKGYIAAHIGLDKLLSLIEHYTGSLENAIYNTCRSAGMPNWMAGFVAKTIMLVIF
ncbi:MAG: hypothetical protein LBV19_04045 [Streptococcaceae bacterium]|nr:hypothetical protein [Streptococcaceae bacterium]